MASVIDRREKITDNEVHLCISISLIIHSKFEMETRIYFQKSEMICRSGILFAINRSCVLFQNTIIGMTQKITIFS